MLLHAHLALFGEGDALSFQHPPLFTRSAEGEALGQGSILEHHPMTGDIIRLQPRGWVGAQGIAHIAR